MKTDFLNYWKQKRKNKLYFIFTNNFKLFTCLLFLPFIFAFSDNGFFLDKDLLKPLIKNISFFYVLWVFMNFSQYRLNEKIYKKSLPDEE